MKRLTRKRRDKLEARARNEIWDMAEVYREAMQATARLLLLSLQRCRAFPAYEPKVLDGEPPMCGCPACAQARATLTTHLRSIAVQRALVEALMTDIGRATGVKAVLS